MTTGYVYVTQDGKFRTTPNLGKITVYLDKPSPSNQYAMEYNSAKASLKIKKVSIKILNEADGE
jgi:hypothetical protein